MSELLRDRENRVQYRRVWPAQARAAREVGARIEDSYNQRRRHSVRVS